MILSYFKIEILAKRPLRMTLSLKGLRGEIDNHLRTEFKFSSIFEIMNKIGSYRLPAHRRSTHRKYFRISFLNCVLKFQANESCVSSWALMGKSITWFIYSDFLLNLKFICHHNLRISVA